MIGVFDSGFGGLSVLAAIAHSQPRADLLYLADSAYMPWGDKPPGFITGRVLAIGAHLRAQGCNVIVAACNTATTASIHALREQLPNIPVVGVEPGVKPAALSSAARHIAVLATEATAVSPRLAKLIASHAANVRVAVTPCPGWATRVEALDADTGELREEIAAKITPLLAAGVDRIVLGCTHYSFLAPLMQPLLAGRAEIVDVAAAVARQVLRVGGGRTGDARLLLQATAQPQRLAAALPALGLHDLAGRLQHIDQVSV